MGNNDHKYFRTIMDIRMWKNVDDIMFDAGLSCDTCPCMNDEFTVYSCEECYITEII